MRRLRILLTVAILAAAPFVFIAGVAEAAAPGPAPTFTVTPNPVVAGHTITFSGTGCLRRSTDPAGTPLTVTVAGLEGAAPARIAQLAQPMADDDLTTTPKSDGTWSLQLDVPDYVVGVFQFGAECDGYNWSTSYRPVTLTVVPNPESAALVLLPAFLDSAAKPSLSTGTSYEVAGLGFGPAEKVYVTLRGDPSRIATLTADDYGIVDGFFTLPDATVSGNYLLSLVGATTGKVGTVAITVVGASPTVTTTATAVATVTVTSAPSTSVPSTSSPSETTGSPSETTGSSSESVPSQTVAVAGSTLASTGTATGQMVCVAAVLTLLGAGTLVASRRRSHRSH